MKQCSNCDGNLRSSRPTWENEVGALKGEEYCSEKCAEDRLTWWAGQNEIDDAAIRALRSEAERAGDVDQVRLCDQALGWVDSSRGLQEYARQKCTEAIVEARARL